MPLPPEDELLLQEVLLLGNDVKATRLVFELLNLKPEEEQKRDKLLLTLGGRYLILALLTAIALLGHRINRLFFPQPILSGETDEASHVTTWLEEAKDTFSAVFEQRASR